LNFCFLSLITSFAWILLRLCALCKAAKKEIFF